MTSSDLWQVRPRWEAAPTPFRHTWEEVVNVDQYRWLVRHDMLEQLSMVQRELGAKHVRAVGMFDDEMRVYCQGPDTFGAPEPRPARTNWQIIGSIWDALLARGLSPMITTSFVPSRMAGGPTTVFTTRGHTSPPRDYAEWSRLVSEMVRHAVDCYGIEVVRGWCFEVWNEPNLQGWFWGADQAEFWRLWESTYRAIKHVDAGLKVGGPSTARAEWIGEFLELGRSRDCVPDYLTLHIYNNDGDAVALAPFDGPQEDKVGTSPNLAAGVVRGARALASQLGFRGEIHFNEWGSSWRAHEPARETANEAAFVVRTLADVSQEADQFAYWCVSDIYDQVGYGRETFHGNYGLLNLQGLRKPAYHAFALLHRLGNMRVPVADARAGEFQGAIATLGDREAQVMIYAYQHEDRPIPRLRKVAVELPRSISNDVKPVLYRVDSRENNVLSRWRDLGAPAYLHPREREELRAADATQQSPFPVEISSRNGRLMAEFAIEDPGVALLVVPISNSDKVWNPLSR